MTVATESWVEVLREGVEKVRTAKRRQTLLEDWFLVQEIRMEEREAMRREGLEPDGALGQAHLLSRVARRMPLRIEAGAALAGSQDCAFSPSYALINPSFKVEEFAGYCDPTAIYSDIAPREEAGLTAERIERVRNYWADTDYVRDLHAVYQATGDETREVVYFIEPVTGHTIPDLREVLRIGVVQAQQQARALGTEYGEAMAVALEAVAILGDRYWELARQSARETEDENERRRLETLAAVLDVVPKQGAGNLHEAIQSFVLFWQAMVLEQAPNPYAFSAGNLDRVLWPYYQRGGGTHEEAVELVRHLLCFYQVGNRCWAISQNVIAGGRDAAGRDLTSEMTEIVLDAFFATNDPQPALSVKVHADTPESLYRSLGRFFFTPGHSTPSLFNDDMMFEVLRSQGVDEEDLPDYSIAGCQEPLIMGKASLNTTNTWLNLAKVLELTLNDGRSTLTGRQLGPTWDELGYRDCAGVYGDLENAFFRVLDRVLPRMQEAGNACTRLLGQHKPVPLTSAVMEGLRTGRDMRDPVSPGVRYNASGCLIHGLSVVADSFQAVGRALESGEWSAEELREALKTDFQGQERMRQFLACQEKFGRNLKVVDGVTARLAATVSARVRALKNPAGNAYLADWSTPSTHLLYGYWVGATPDGRHARAMLGYGLDARPQHRTASLEDRLLSAHKLPYRMMTGGYASHIGLRPDQVGRLATLEEKGLWMRDRVISPLFRLGEEAPEAPYYVYFNVDSAANLREVLRNPKRYAPEGIYIMRIHGTFVNFLDLSPAIQEDIIARLEPELANV